MRSPLQIRGLTILPGLVLALAVGGCVSSNIEQVRTSATGMSAGDSVAILGRRHARGYETERGFVECVGENLGKQLNVIPEQGFVDLMYPWFEPRMAPLKSTDLPDLLSYDPVRERLESEGVRYVVWIDGSTNTTDSGGAMTCTLSPAGGGCFGFMTWEKDSKYESSIWDVRNQRGAGKISSDANGTSFMPALIVPVPLIARVEASACNSLSQQLGAFLSEG